MYSFAAAFISCLSQLGSTFTVLVAGKRMTFVTDFNDFHSYFNSRQADFQQAVQHFTERTGNAELKAGYFGKIRLTSYMHV